MSVLRLFVTLENMIYNFDYPCYNFSTLYQIRLNITPLHQYKTLVRGCLESIKRVN